MHYDKLLYFKCKEFLPYFEKWCSIHEDAEMLLSQATLDGIQITGIGLVEDAEMLLSQATLVWPPMRGHAAEQVG